MKAEYTTKAKKSVPAETLLQVLQGLPDGHVCVVNEGVGVSAIAYMERIGISVQRLYKKRK